MKCNEMINMLLLIVCYFIPKTLAATIAADKTNLTLPNGTDEISHVDCQEICGCDRIFKYDAVKDECMVNIEYLKELTATKNYVSTDNDMQDEDKTATKLRERVDKVFQGILISAVLFVICASICVVSVCILCCHIRYTDRKLKNEVKALTNKLKIERPRKYSAPLLKKKRDQIEESCNVVVQEANIMCV